MATALRIDRTGEAEVPPGWPLISTELDWLAHVADAAPGQLPGAAHVRGEALCAWAATYWRALGGEVVPCDSPVDELRHLCPALTPEQAHAVLAELPPLVAPTLPQVLAALYPGYEGWSGPASATEKAILTYVARWLRWASDRPTAWPAAHQALIEATVASWELSAKLRPLAVVSVTDARDVLGQWLGVEFAPASGSDRQQALEGAGAYPCEVPTQWLMRTQEVFRGQLLALTTQAASEQPAAALAWWQHQVQAPLAYSVRTEALRALLDFLPKHPLALSEALLIKLEPVASAGKLDELRALIPVAAPPPMPTAPAEVLGWVTDYYLPYRRWQALSNDPEATMRVRTLAGAFAQWFLDAYKGLLGASLPYQQLHWSQRATQPDPEAVVIWVITDGLGWLDARRLQDYVRRETHDELVVETRTPCFGLVPSITEFTKNSVRWGLPPVATVKEKLPEPPRPDVKSAGNLGVAVAAAQVGDVVVWRPAEPDHSYHGAGDADTVRRSADHALLGLAKEIGRAVAAVSDDLPVRLLITTDHGRMLGPSERTLAVPLGYSVHGRAAYGGPSGALAAPAPDTDDVRWLAPGTYALPGWVGVAVGEASFRIPVGTEGASRGGSELFQHGGAWPEEVVVPWIEFRRATPLFAPQAGLEGAAPAGQPATAQLRVQNPNTRSLRLREVHVQIGGQTPVVVPLGAVCGGMQTQVVEVPLPYWPDSAQTAGATATLVAQTPDGAEHTFPLGMHLRNTGLQDRTDDILADL